MDVSRTAFTFLVLLCCCYAITPCDTNSLKKKAIDKRIQKHITFRREVLALAVKRREAAIEEDDILALIDKGFYKSALEIRQNLITQYPLLETWILNFKEPA